MAGKTESIVLGPVSAYAIAVANGYTGTEQEWAAEIAAASTNAQSLAANALISEGYATGKQNGVTVVDSSSPYYEKNAYYHSQQAAGSATAANNAKVAAEDARDAAQLAAGDFQGLTFSVTGLAAGSDPTVQESHSGGNYSVQLGIPKGDKGDKGDTGNPAPAEQVTPAVNAYLEEHFSNPSNPPLDRSLASNSSAAPADLVGNMKKTVDTHNNGIFSEWRHYYFNETTSTSASNRGNKYWNVGFVAGKTYKIKMEVLAHTQLSNATFSMNVRTTNIAPISSASDIVEEISGEYARGAVSAGDKFEWNFTPTYNATYLYVAFAKQAGSLCSYRLDVEEHVNIALKKATEYTDQIIRYDPWFVKLELGGVVIETGAAGSNTKNMRTKILHLPKGTYIHSKSNDIFIDVYWYSDLSGTYICRANQYQNLNSFQITETGFYRIRIGKTDGTTFSDTQQEYETYEKLLQVDFPVNMGTDYKIKNDSAVYERLSPSSLFYWATYTRNSSITNGAILMDGKQSSCITSTFERFPAGKFVCPIGYKCRYIIMDENNNRVRGEGTSETEYSFRLSGTQKIVFYIERTDTANLTDNDFAAIISGARIYKIDELDGGTILYEGNRIRLQKNTLDCYEYMSLTKPSGITSAYQGIAVYGDVLLQAFNLGYWAMYNLATKSGTAISSGRLDGATSSMHANTACFGAKYASGDPFPLLYTTGGLAGTNNPAGQNDHGYCVVHRIEESNGAYTTELLQTIYIDWSGFEAKGYHPVFVRPNFMVEEGFLYTFSALYRTDGSYEQYDNVNRFVVHKYHVPVLTNSTVTLTADDVVEEYLFEYDTFFMQGGTVYNDMLFHTFGCGSTVGTATTKPRKNAIRAYDVISGTEIAKIDGTLLPYASQEPEGLAGYGNMLLANTNSGKVYCIEFP